MQTAGGEYRRGNRKAAPRRDDKVRQDYGGDYSRLVDLERGAGVFGDVGAAKALLAALRDPGDLLLRRFKDRVSQPLPSGFRDLLASVEDPDSGLVGELQVTFSRFNLLTSQAHKMHVLARDVSEPSESRIIGGGAPRPPPWS